MAEFRQGEGATKTFKALGPTTRTDGTALAISEISHYIRFVEWTDENGTVHPVEQMNVDFIEDANTPEYDGQFDEVVDIDAIGVGSYDYWYRTVDTGGRESADSERVNLVVLAPLANPSPPTSITVG